jgi:hypothetical protein
MVNPKRERKKMSIMEFYDNACIVAHKVSKIKPSEVSATVSRIEGNAMFRCKHGDICTNSYIDPQKALDEFEQLLIAKKNANTLSASK